MVDIALNKSLQKNFDLPIQEDTATADVQNILANYVNELIQQDFNHLISLLYKIDVDEAKLKQLLKEQSQQDAGKIIADLIIERQLQKINSRKNFNNNNLSDEAKW